MCGIVGYIGPQQAASLLFEGLRRLEYRGYDSAGIAVHDGKQIHVVRAVGKLSQLAQAMKNKPLTGNVGIGHTRWATHGRPNELNAHPHAAGDIVVVHNGIIENHLELRNELQGHGVQFASETDTEIIAHLVNNTLQTQDITLWQAVQQSLKHVKGSYAIAVMSQSDPSLIVVAKNASPLVIGQGNGEMLCASDIPAILTHTRDMILLEDGDVAELKTDQVRIITLQGEEVTRAQKHIDWSPVMAEKGGYKHFMLKEIFEQPRAVEDTLRGRVLLQEGDILQGEIDLSESFVKDISRVTFIACGTSYHASIAGSYWIEQLARVASIAEMASEIRYRKPVFTSADLVVAVSQSGETADTLAAVKEAKRQGAHVLAVCNVLDSAIARAADKAFYTHAGPEIGVASTKCFTTQLTAMLMLAVFLARRRETITSTDAREILQALIEVPKHMRGLLEQAPYLMGIAKKLVGATDVLYLGRGLGFPVALEGALKLKEVSYIHAEGYPAGEMKHGPIALIDETVPTVVVCPKDSLYEKVISNIQEVRAREGQVVAIATAGDTSISDMADHLFLIPKAKEEVLPLLTVVPLQLLSYYVADYKGTDVDQPRNLAKTVTVE